MMVEDIIRSFKQASLRLLLLDYDGTLVNFSKRPAGLLPPAHLIQALSNLCDHPDVKPVIVTGRSVDSVEKLFGGFPIDVIAEHGALVRRASNWEAVANRGVSWRAAVQLIVEAQCKANPGSVAEYKTFGFTWHYRGMRSGEGRQAAKVLMDALAPAARLYELNVRHGKKIVEVMPVGISKGTAVLDLLKDAPFDFVVAIGDDKTDEDMFDALAGMKNCYTIKVGRGSTAAKYRLDNVADVFNLLNEFHRSITSKQ